MSLNNVRTVLRTIPVVDRMSMLAASVITEPEASAAQSVTSLVNLAVIMAQHLPHEQRETFGHLLLSKVTELDRKNYTNKNQWIKAAR